MYRPLSRESSMPSVLPAHLRRLEAESIHIMREVVAEMRNPVMLYSIGKDSSVMLHVALKAFYPAKPPFPLLHVDTTWKFREMIAFRDETARRLGLDLIVHINEDGVTRGISPIASGSQLHTQVMKTEALRQALDKRRLRRRLRRRAARRGEEPRQGAHLLASLRRARLGSAQSAPGALAAVQHAHPRRRIDARLPAVELDRARRLGIRAGREHSGRAALFRQGAAGRRARRHADHGRRRPPAAAARRDSRRCGAFASARSAAIR